MEAMESDPESPGFGFRIHFGFRNSDLGFPAVPGCGTVPGNRRLRGLADPTSVPRQTCGVARKSWLNEDGWLSILTKSA
jgi:hypothetical protein